MSQELEKRTGEVPEHLSVPGQAVMQAFEGAPIDPRTWSMYAQIAKTIKGTEFVPEALRGSEAGILACMLYGNAQGLHPMVALAEISMIDGKPAMSAELMVAKIRAAGHSITREEILADGHVAGIRAHGKRSDGDEDSYTFTLDMARRAGLLSKRNWQNYPEAMLWARAASQVARQLFSDVFLGQSVYVPDELGDDMEVAEHDQIETAEGVEPVEAVEEPGEEAAPSTDEAQEAAREAIEQSFPVPLTRELIEACDSKAELLALAERFGVAHTKRDPIVDLTKKLMAHLRAQQEAEAEAEPAEAEPVADDAKVDLNLEPERDEAEVAEQARHDALLARIQEVLVWVQKNHPDSPLTEQRILEAASKQFDRPIGALQEMTGDELEEIWKAIPEKARGAIVEGVEA